MKWLWRAAQFQLRHTGGTAPSLRRSTPPSLPSGGGMGSAQGTAFCREGGERDFSDTNQAASTNDGGEKTQLSMLQSKAS